MSSCRKRGASATGLGGAAHLPRRVGSSLSRGEDAPPRGEGGASQVFSRVLGRCGGVYEVGGVGGVSGESLASLAGAVRTWMRLYCTDFEPSVSRTTRLNLKYRS